MPAYITGSANEDLLRKIKYLLEENRLLLRRPLVSAARRDGQEFRAATQRPSSSATRAMTGCHWPDWD
jgi:hypothetical protein